MNTSTINSLVFKKPRKEMWAVLIIFLVMFLILAGAFGIYAAPFLLVIIKPVQILFFSPNNLTIELDAKGTISFVAGKYTFKQDLDDVVSYTFGHSFSIVDFSKPFEKNLNLGFAKFKNTRVVFPVIITGPTTFPDPTPEIIRKIKESGEEKFSLLNIIYQLHPF